VTSRARFSLYLVAACLGGILAGLAISSSAFYRNLISVRSGRGALVGMCDGAAIYESDLKRSAAERAEISDSTDQEQMQGEWTLTRSETGANIALENAARHQGLSRAAIDREVELTRSQFRSPLSWIKVLYSNGLSPWRLRDVIAKNLRSQAWIENKIATTLTSTEQECAAYFDSHRSTFAQPMRLRARHIFFAAPPGSPSDVVEQKQALAQGILDRLGRGEVFENLAMESEDESNKWRDGDLNFFAESRMPADFWAAVRERHPGDPAMLIRTGLGFHVVEVTDARPARQMTMEEARSWIVLALQNQKRAAAVTALRQDLLGRVHWVAAEPASR